MLKIRYTAFGVCLAALCFAPVSWADTITFGGTISQGAGDQGVGAVNDIAPGDHYTVTIDFSGTISSDGFHPLGSATVSFVDPTATATISSFTTPESVTVTTTGSTSNISVFACLASGDCFTGNDLGANFDIPAAGLNAAGVAATLPVGQAVALDISEGGGLFDIQGSVTSYSYGTTPVPLPPSSMLMGCGFALLWFMRRRVSLKQAHFDSEA